MFLEPFHLEFFHGNNVNIIGNGVVIDPVVLKVKLMV
jgi:hypothetical protein